uniref:Thymidine kinase n=1 Tax=Timema shepardi TaxID=629360 RepID=A0A7R9B984_TIMSH|nr:unnamed protein product [Timema shepardi]
MANEGKVVIVAALDGTFQRVGFGRILELVPLAESVVKLQAVCVICYSNASYTKRIGNEKEVSSYLVSTGVAYTCNFYPWDHIKSLVYATTVDNKEEFTIRIWCAIDNINATPTSFEDVRFNMLHSIHV